MVFAYSKEAVGRLERDVCAAKARIRELEAENAVLKNRFDKYDIPDAELDKILVALPDLKAQAKAATDSEIREALLKIDLALEALAVNLKIARAALARKDAALAAMYSATEPIAIADEHDITSEEGYTSINENTRKAIVKARALIAAALKAEKA